MIDRTAGVGSTVRIDLYTSAFCGPCHAARRAVGDVARLVPALDVQELDVAAHPDRVEQDEIRSTPTIIVRDGSGAEVFRGSGVPTQNQLLTALARAL